MQNRVLIVGAGPAGAYTAYKLAEQNINVLLLEKEQLPRYKSCGGAVSLKAQNLLADFDLEAVIETKIKNITFTYDSTSPVTIKLKKPFVQLVMRDAFDYFLTQQASQQGVQVIQNSEVTDLINTTNEVKVITNQNQFKADIIVGADGINSLVADQLNINPITNQAVGFEKEIKPTSIANSPEPKIRLDYGIVPKGYGWVFPKEDHLSVGVATYQQGINLKQKLTSYLQQEQLTDYTELKAKGHLVPLWNQPAKLNAERGLVVGDAAGLVDPLSGEGIYYALKSGQLASQAIINYLTKDLPLDKYTEAVNDTIIPEFKTAKLLTKPFFHFPGKIHQIINNKPIIFKKFLQIIYGTKQYNELYKSLFAEMPLLKQFISENE